MRPLLLVLVVVAFARGAAAGPPVSARVRAATPAAQMLLDTAIAQSAIVVDLASAIEHTDLVVYIELTGSTEIPRARTKLVAATPAARFLRISINTFADPWSHVALLAHELQHALEIARSADVRDDEGIRRLYGAIGVFGGPDQFETAEAREIERRVRAELLARK